MNPEAKAFIRIKKADNYMKRKTNPYIFFIPIYYILQRTANCAPAKPATAAHNRE
jgi:hypothetical protein